MDQSVPRNAAAMRPYLLSSPRTSVDSADRHLNRPGGFSQASRRYSEAHGRSLAFRALILRHGNSLIRVHVLNGVEQLDAFGHGSLEGFSAGNEAHAAGAFVDDRGLGRVGEVAGPGRLAAGVNQPAAAHVASHDLVPGQVDGVVAGELLVHELAGLSEIEG